MELETISTSNLQAVEKESGFPSLENVMNHQVVHGKRVSSGSSEKDDIPGPSTQKRERKSFEKSPTQSLLEEQVKLLKEQVNCFYKIIDLMEERNKIEKDKCSALQKKILVDVEDADLSYFNGA